ncbi:MAG TPA: phosphomannomutase/phosphoglucomutase [Methanofastidiosum sp.]|nr:phosphomannomutase/phosphoglucomutase [Methanofastidiosum sp.]HNU61837.1 phosphomannomutase/phosphoglucomutase [Methanofastidiosum sp.]
MPFKAYDIRGIYPDQIGEEFAYGLGRALGKSYDTIAVGIDSRIGSDNIKDYFMTGIMDEISDVVYLGRISTPLLYYATKDRFSLGVMITASHNPKEYTGFKACNKNAIPLSPQDEIKKEFKIFNLPNRILHIRETRKDIIDEYKNFFISKLIHLKKFKIVSDFSNGSTVIENSILKEVFPYIITLNETPDGNFPGHPPNSIGLESTKKIRAKVLETGSDIGIIFDGDGDRIGFIDEKGREVRGDILSAIIAREVLKEKKGDKILYDLRSSKSVPESIESSGGIPIKSRVGHPFIKKLMRKEGAVFAGEFSNHFYFKEAGYFESPLLALYYVLKSLEKKSLSLQVDELTRYIHSGEINVKTENPIDKITELKNLYKGKNLEEIDGITISDKDWWVNVRPSNTEPLLRITAEASDEEALNQILSKVKEIIGEK